MTAQLSLLSSLVGGVVSVLLAFAAAGFLYVALADLVPAQRGKTSLRLALLDFVLLGAGVGVIALVARTH